MSPLLLVLFIFPALTVGQSTRPAVLDVNGHELKYGVEYYVLPVSSGGGFTLVDRNNTCPLHVGQENKSVGYPIRFSPATAGEKIIRLYDNFNVDFPSVMTTCVQLTVWAVGNQDEVTGRRFIVSGGSMGNPSRSTLRYWFRVEEEGEGYKLVFCPPFCEVCRVRCGKVGVLVEGSKRLLALDGDALAIKFRRA